MVKQHQKRRYQTFKRFRIIAAAALYFGCSLWTGLRADDSAIYVNKVPSAETPNVMFTIDTSGSMDTIVPDGSQTRIEAVKAALKDLINTTSNLKAGLERFHYELGAPIVFPVINLNSTPDFLNGSVSVSSIDRSSDDAAERNDQVYLDDRSLNLTQVQVGGDATVKTLEVTPLLSNDDDEAGTAGNETLTSPDLDVGQTNAGVRFPLVSIPRNATILHAEVEFVENSGHAEDTDLRIYGHNVSDSPAFEETGSNSVTSRFSNLTNANVDWSNVSALTAGQYVTTPNVRDIIQEIVNRTDWPAAGGNPITLLFQSITGHRELSTIDGGTPPVLRIQYVDSGTKVVQQVADSNDDANEVSGNLTTGYYGFYMLRNYNGTYDYSHAGVLFRNVDIPDDAVVVWSDIDFTTRNQQLSDPVDLVINGILNPSLDGFGYGNLISTQPLTTSTVDWVGGLSEGDEEIFTPNDGETLWTPNLAPLVEEMRANSSFQNGDTLGFVFTDPDGGNVNNRQACSFDGAQNTNGCPEGIAGKPTLDVFYAFPTGGTDVQQQVGLRFNNVQVPQGAAITSASLEFTVDAATANPGDLTIAIEDNTAPQTYSNDSGQKISDRTYGTSTTWTTDTWDNIGDTKQSVDISSLVSSVTDNTGWCGGGSLAFRITSSDARLIAQAFDKGGSGAPTLRIAYRTDNLTTGQGCTTRQTSISINDQGNDSEEAKQDQGGFRGYKEGQIDLYSGDLDMDDQWLVGLRFENVDVPKGATITSANLYMSAANYTPDSGEDSVVIQAQQHPNAPSFSRGRHDLSNRVSTGDPSVTWDITNTWNQNVIYSTQDSGTDIKSLLQPIINGDVIVNGETWASGNALALILDGQGPQNRRGAACCGFPPPARLEISYQIKLGADNNAVTGRDALLSIVNDLVASGYTPPVDALYEAGAYFKGEAVHWGRTRGAGQSYEASGPTNDSDLDSQLIDWRTGQPITDAQLLAEGERSRLSHPATYGSDVEIIREGNCTATDPNNRDCRTEHFKNTESATYVSPFSTAQACEKGFLVLLSDGIANRNSSRDLIKNLTGRTSCPMRIPQIDSAGNAIISNGSFSFRDPSSDEQCGLELADYLQKTDFIPEDNPATDVLNNVRTFTIGFNLPVENSTENRHAVEFLKALAFVGNGGNLDDPNGVPDLKYGDDFYTADNADQLKDVFKTIVNEINKETTSFVAPGISINAFNRLFNLNDIYFSLFRPDDKVGWLGNMKKYKLCEEKDSDTCSYGEVIDKNGNPAVYQDITDLDNYGTLKPEAQGYWSDPTDSAPEIAQGGAGEKIPTYTMRNVYVNTSSGAVTPPTDFSNVRTTGTALHPIDLNSNDVDGDGTADDPTSFTGLKAALRDQGNCTSGTFADQNACLNDLIYWMTGLKFPGDLPRHGNDSDVDRWAFGDPMHSRPLVLTYGKDDAGTPDNTTDDTILSKIFVGTNDGGIRMINEGDGAEEWIFYPNSMLAMQSDLKDNPNGTHLYGVDATPTARIRNVNGDGIIDPNDGDFVHLYFGLRRGGRQVFALNVTPDSKVIGVTDNDGNVIGKKDLVTPELLWRIDGDDPKFQRLGQTWSTPRPVRIAGPDGPRTVLIFGGGYDTRQDGTDTDGTSPDGGDIYNNSSSGDSMGNAIFIVDADTGERLWWASSSNDGNGDAPDAVVSSMNTAIPAPITPLDTNNDGLVDRLYAVDLRGQIFRVDLDSATPTSGESEFAPSTVGVLARLGSDTANADRRKFFYAPEVARVNDEAVVQEPYELIGIVSGNRAQPQGKTVQDRTYAVRDFLTDNPSGGLSSTNFPACNPLLTGCTPGSPVTNSDLTDVTDQSAFVIRQDNGGAISLTNASGTDLTSSDTALTNLKNSYGWYFDLEGANFDSQDANPPLTGEKGFSTVTVLGGRMFFTTFLPPSETTPTTDVCSAPAAIGTSRFYAVDFFTGAPAFDRNADSTFDKAERFTNLGAGPSADIVPAYLPGGPVLPVPTGAGAVPQDPGPLTTVNKTFWIEEE